MCEQFAYVYWCCMQHKPACEITSTKYANRQNVQGAQHENCYKCFAVFVPFYSLFVVVFVGHYSIVPSIM